MVINATFLYVRACVRVCVCVCARACVCVCDGGELVMSSLIAFSW